MVFKPSFKCYKNEKFTFYSSDYKTRMFVLSEYIYYFTLYYIRRAIKTQKKEKESGRTV